MNMVDKNEGAADMYYGKESGGPKRKYYKITEYGLKVLEKYICDWNKLKEIVAQLGI